MISKPIKMKGFTLIELMIVVVIIGILALIAYPSYVDSVRKSRRGDGQAALLNAAQQMEVYYARNATYSTTLTASNIAAASDDRFYNNLVIENGVTNSIVNSYRLTITATGSQAADTISDFRLHSTGLKQRKENGAWKDEW